MVSSPVLLLSFALLVSLECVEEKVVKLTSKQGLIMNQVLSTYALDGIKHPTCRNHTNRYKMALRSFEPWALNMFDSSSKLQSGILVGNLVDFGSFSQCIRIDYEGIKGKHCFVKITPTLDLIKKILRFRNISEKRFGKVRLIVERSALFWSICVPASCPAGEVLQYFSKIIIEYTHGLNLSISLERKHCLTSEETPKMGFTQYVAVCFLLLFVLMALLCSLMEYFYTKAKLSLVSAFSIPSNLKKIIERKGSNELDCVHGLRVLSTCYVVIGHRYLTAMFFPVINGLEILDWILNYSSTIIIGGTVCVDTFFFISGMLVSIGFFRHVAQNGTFNILHFYLYRYLRITPALGVVVLIYATLVQFFGYGPLWYETCDAHSKPCQYYWWSTLLHIQSYVNPGALCIIQTWYLTCDMCFFYFSPIVLYPLWKWRTCGLINSALCYTGSVVVSFYLAWINDYEGGMPITGQLLETKYFQRHYIAPHARAPPYIIGLCFGFSLFRRRNRKTKMNHAVALGGWLAAGAVMVVSVVGCRRFQLENHSYDRLEASLFLSCSRSVWTMGIMWMVWACANGHGGIVNRCLSSYMLRVLARVSYGVFLLHFMLQLFKNGANKMPIYFSNFTAICDSLSDLLLIFMVSFVFTLVFEMPLTTMLLNGRKKVKPESN